MVVLRSFGVGCCGLVVLLQRFVLPFGCCAVVGPSTAMVSGGSNFADSPYRTGVDATDPGGVVQLVLLFSGPVYSIHPCTGYFGGQFDVLPLCGL